MKTEFDAAIGILPPSPIDVDRLIVRGRRRALLRRVVVAGAGGGVAAVAVGVVVALQPGGGAPARPTVVMEQPSVAASSHSSAAPTSGPAHPRSALPPVDTTPTPAAQARATATRLTQALKDVVRAKAPGYTFAATEDGPAFTVKYLYHARTESNRGFDSYFGTANLAGPTGSGNLAVNVGRTGPLWSHTGACRADQPECNWTTDPDGARVLRQVIRENGIVDNYVIVERPDGNTVLIVAANQGGQLDTGAGRQAAPVLTLDQLVAIAKDPRLSV